MSIIAINIGTRVIDKLLPQQHKEVTEQQAVIYKRLLPTEIKILEVGATEPIEAKEEVQESAQESVQTVKQEPEKEPEKEPEQEQQETSLSIEEIFSKGEAI